MDETLRQFVRERAGHHCEYCRIPQDAAPFLLSKRCDCCYSEKIDPDQEESTWLSTK